MCMKRTKANELCAEIGSEGVLCYKILPQLAAIVAFVKHLEDHSYKLQFFCPRARHIGGSCCGTSQLCQPRLLFCMCMPIFSFYASLNNRRAFWRRLFLLPRYFVFVILLLDVFNAVTS